VRDSSLRKFERKVVSPTTKKKRGWGSVGGGGGWKKKGQRGQSKTKEESLRFEKKSPGKNRSGKKENRPEKLGTGEA